MSKLSSTGGQTITATHYPNDNIQESPSVEHIQLLTGELKKEAVLFTEVILITEGTLLLSYDHFFDYKVTKGKVILIPPGCDLTLRAGSRVSAFIVRIKEAVRICQGYTIDNIVEKETIWDTKLSTLAIKPQVGYFLAFLKDNIESGLSNPGYLSLKADELVFLLKAYYTTEELRKLFLPLLSKDARFHEFVLRHYRKVKTVREFAELCNSSMSNFEKRFNKAFGMPPHKWMQQKRVNLLYHEISATDKPLRQIAKEQKFLSLPQFNDFCKKHFGYPPGKMRKLASIFQKEDTFL